MNTSKPIFKFIRITSYEEKPVDPPQVCIDATTTEYQKNVMSWTLPWDLTEKERCAFVESILTDCIASINIKIREERKKGKKVDECLYTERRLELHKEVELKESGMLGVGKADYVIQRNDRMVVVTEAKRCDMTQTKHQNFAVMKADRILNKHVDTPYRTIKGICTDFQNRVFVSRERQAICTDATSITLTNGMELPENFLRIVKKVYGMFTRL
ncbi:hypothetical protein DVH05_007748 [Phytophthora capsici]|nr:hypothetical protein DVH05_007748 [Phytophthora capsici]